jgi:transcriptional regulator with XRE-family HTH domain
VLDALSIFLDYLSRGMEKNGSDVVTQRIAGRVRALRADRGLSLVELAARTRVSRSALSLIERGESSPTAVVLDRIAVGLGVTLASLFAPAHDGEAAAPLIRRADQPVWRDPSSGYVRRSVSPGADSSLQIVEISFPAGGRVVFDTAGRDHVVHQQLWVLEGTIEFTLGSETHRLDAGDCLAARIDRPTMFHNPTSRPVRYAVLSTDAGGRG